MAIGYISKSRMLIIIILLLLLNNPKIYGFKLTFRKFGFSFNLKNIFTQASKSKFPFLEYKNQINILHCKNRIDIAYLNGPTSTVSRDKIISRILFPYLDSNLIINSADDFLDRNRSRANAIIIFEDDLEIRALSELIEKFDYHLFISNDTLNDFLFSNKGGYLLSNLEFHYRKLLERLTNDFIPSDIEIGNWTHFLCLTYSNLQEMKPYVEELEKGIDAFEIRVDLLEDRTLKSLMKQVEMIRSYSRLPIIFTLRSKPQWGKFEGEFIERKNIIREAFRLGIDWIDIEASNTNNSKLKDIFNSTNNQLYQKSSKIIGSIHYEIKELNQYDKKRKLYTLLKTAGLNGYAKMKKLVIKTSDFNDIFLLNNITKSCDQPTIGFCVGNNMSLSRALNQYYTPVTHSILSPAIPNQLTADELMIIRQRNSMIHFKKFFLFGNPIKNSPSPILHNSGFKEFGLPYNYSILEFNNVNKYIPFMKSPQFGGASVTIPFKESIIPLLDELSDPAKQIGAVNTISIDKNRVLKGHNTDWIGIYNSLLAVLSHKKGILINIIALSNRIGLVIGAGGTARAACYAIKKLGMNLVVVNRNFSKACILAERFSGKAVKIDELNNSSYSKDLELIVSTIPSKSNFQIPDCIFSNKPIVMDVVYNPYFTDILKIAFGKGCDTICGINMLFEQAIGQFEIWNSRPAPRRAMKKALINSNDSIFKDKDIFVI